MDNGRFSPRQKLLRAKLKAARKNAKLTQKQLASVLSKPQSFVSKIETGERKVESLELDLILTALGLDTEIFISDLKSELQ